MLRPILITALAAACTMPAAAQASRSFPANALRGTLQITSPPEVLLNGRPARLAPGARIRGSDNMMALSASLVGQRFRVNYTIEPLGLVHDVWILTADEAARRPWPTHPDEAARWQFDAAAQTWTRP